MSIGEFIAGAGQVGGAIRKTQAELRDARFKQLQLEEANRTQQMYNQLAGQMQAAGLDYKGLSPGAKLSVVDVPAEKPVAKKPAVPAKKAGGSKPATPSTAAPAARGPKTTYTPPAVPSATAVPGANPPLSGGEGTINLSGGPGADRLAQTTDRPEIFSPEQTAFYGSVWDAIKSGVTSATTRLGAGAVSPYGVGGMPPPPQTRGAPTAAPTPATPATPAAAPSAAPSDTQFIYPVNAGVTPPEARAAAPVQPSGDVSPAAPKTPKEIVQSETTASQAPVPEAVKKKVEFYLADPTVITQDMQKALNKREELVRYANIMLASRTGQGVQAFLQIKQQIDAIDDGMIELQGMQGIQELTDQNDPRRLAAVLSQVSGNRLAIQPRSDGTYNIVAAPGTPQQQVIEGAEGISANEVAVHAMRRFSPTYRAQEIADNRTIQMKVAEAQLQANLEGVKAGYEYKKFMDGKFIDVGVEEAKLMNALQVAHMNNQGKITAAMAKAAGAQGMKLHNAADGSLFGEKAGSIYLFTPKETTVVEDKWIGPDVTIETPGQFRLVQQGQ